MCKISEKERKENKIIAFEWFQVKVPDSNVI